MSFAEYERYDGLGLAELVRGRQVKADELVEAALARIEARNPALNAVVHTMAERARAEAAGGGVPRAEAGREPAHGAAASYRKAPSPACRCCSRIS